jgi:hypothetical protein
VVLEKFGRHRERLAKHLLSARAMVPIVHLAFANDPRHYRGNCVISGHLAAVKARCAAAPTVGERGAASAGNARRDPCALAIKQAPSQEGGPGRDYRDIHRTDAPPASVLAMPSEVVDWTGGRRLGCIVPAGAWIDCTWIGRTWVRHTWVRHTWVRHTWVECHRKTPPPRASMRLCRLTRYGPSSEPTSWGLCPSDLKPQMEFHCESEPEFASRPPQRLTSKYR